MAVIKPRSEKKIGRAVDPATEVKLKKIVADIEMGIPYQIATESNGLSEKHLYNIINQGKIDLEECDDTFHARLVQDLRAIEKKSIVSCLADIRPAEKGHRGAEWILERRFWKHFSPNISVMEITKELDEIKKQLAEKDKGKGK